MHKKRTSGSIADRMIILLIAGMVLVSAAFIGANIYQSSLLSRVTIETNQRQIDSISEVGEDMIARMVFPRRVIIRGSSLGWAG